MRLGLGCVLPGTITSALVGWWAELLTQSRCPLGAPLTPNPLPRLCLASPGDEQVPTVERELPRKEDCATRPRTAQDKGPLGRG